MKPLKALTITKIGSLLTIATIGLFGIAPNADATNINTHGAACQNYFPSQVGDMDYNPSGLKNVNSAPRSVVCPISRSPLPSGNASFYVDGSNPSGSSTTCTISSYNFNGTFLGSSTFTDSAANFDHLVSLPAAQVPTFAYVSALCTLPASGMLRGITALQ